MKLIIAVFVLSLGLNATSHKPQAASPIAPTPVCFPPQAPCPAPLGQLGN